MLDTTKFEMLLQLLTVISTIDDLNYPEKTDTYYIVNAPYIFSACWKVCAQLGSYCLPIIKQSVLAESQKCLILKRLAGC